jgi:hypothetical protein
MQPTRFAVLSGRLMPTLGSVIATAADFLTMKTSDFRLRTNSLLRSLRQYHQIMEEQLASSYQSELDQLGEFEPDDDDAMSASEMIKWDYHLFARSLRYSYIVLLLMILENQLDLLCDYLRESHDLPIRVSKLRGDLIERYKTYFKVARLPEANINWAQVEELHIVRNCLVHTLGHLELSQDEARLRGIIARDQGILVDNPDSDDAALMLQSEYCTQGVDHVDRFLTSLYDAAGFESEW